MSVKKLNLVDSSVVSVGIRVPRNIGNVSKRSGADLPERIITPEVILGLRDLLQAREGLPVEAEYSANAFSENLTLNGIDSDTTVMFRVFNRDRLIVKYVILTKTRAGTLTALVKRLSKRTQECGVTKLVVESVLTPEMRAWCLKHNLTVDPSSGETADGLGVSYIGQLLV